MERIPTKIFSTTCSRFNQQERFFKTEESNEKLNMSYKKKEKLLLRKGSIKKKYYNLDIEEENENFFKTGVNCKMKKKKSQFSLSKGKNGSKIQRMKSCKYINNPLISKF